MTRTAARFATGAGTSAAMSSGLFTAAFLESFGPWLAYDKSADLDAYLTAIGEMNDTTAGIVMDQGFPGDPGYVPGWSTLLDPNNCPAEFLPFLAQFIGVVIQPGTDAAVARAQIFAESNINRGTATSIQNAVTQHLTDTQSVHIIEREGQFGTDPYSFIVIVRSEEVISVQGLTDAVNATKPAGLQWFLIETDAWTIAQMEASQVTLAALEANFMTLQGLESDQPGH